MMVKNSGRKPKGRRYEFDQLVFSLSDWKKSPTSYRKRRKELDLPSPSTLKNFQKRFPLDTGINRAIQNRLCQARKIMSDPLESEAIVIFDELKLMPHLHYDVTRDRIVGFENWGDVSTNKFADHAQVFMLRGLKSGWKIPVAYGFCENSTDSELIVKQLKDVIQLCEESDIKIETSSCDQGGTNRGAIKYMLNRTDELRKSGQHPELQKCEYLNKNNIT